MDEPAGEVAAPVEDGREVEYSPEEEEEIVSLPNGGYAPVSQAQDYPVDIEADDENPAPRGADVGRAIEFD